MSRTKWWMVGALLALIAITVGVIVEEVRRARDRSRYPQVGTSYDIGGRTLNLFCSGQGSPVVVFGTFAHQAGYGWAGVQPEVAKFTRACWWDRAGYGWSDPGPLYRTASDVVEDLHALLQVSNEPSPYVLVGNGDVTLQTRIFHNRYPGELSGAVFIGGNDVEEGPPVSAAGQPKFQRLFGSAALPAARWTVCQVIPAYSRVGLLRLFGGAPRPTNHFGLSREQQAKHAFLSDHPRASGYTQTAQCMQEESRAQARSAGNFGDLAVIVLSSLPARSEDQEMHQFRTRLAGASSRGRVKITTRENVRDEIVAAIKEIMDARTQPTETKVQ